MDSKHIPEVGSIFGKWEVISTEVKSGAFVGQATQRTAFWKVRCSCGRESWRTAYLLISGRTRACKACCRDTEGNSSRIRSFVRKFKSGAVQRGIEWGDAITPELIEEMYYAQEKRCALSGEEISFTDKWKDTKSCTCSLDRIDSLVGYTPDNIQLVHKKVNMLKGPLTTEELLFLCSAIHNNIVASKVS